MNIFKELLYSIYNYKYYPEFLKNKLSKVFGVGVLVSMLFYLIAILCPQIFPLMKMGGFINAYRELVPDFRVEDGRLIMDESYEYEDDTSLIYIDTDYIFYDIYEKSDYLDDYTSVILIDCEKIIVKNVIRYQQLYFSDFGVDFERDDLIFLVRYISLIYVVCVIAACLPNIGYFFAGAFVVTLIGMIIAACMKKKLSFDEVFTLSVYSRTLPVMIKAIVRAFGINIPFFWVVNYGISILILVLAIKCIENRPQIPYNPYYMNNRNQQQT